MTGTKNRILHVDVRVELEDILRANAHVMKPKLIAAWVIWAVTVAGFVWLFIAIEEQAMLLKLSPFFIGLPVVAIIGQNLRSRAAYRKYVEGLSDSQRNAHFIFQDDADGFDVITGKSFIHVAWENVFRVVETPHDFLIYLNKLEARILPKKRLIEKGEEKLLKEMLRDHLGNRVKFLSS